MDSTLLHVNLIFISQIPTQKSTVEKIIGKRVDNKDNSMVDDNTKSFTKWTIENRRIIEYF